MILKKYIVITLLFLFTGCGFKVIDYSKQNDFKIKKIETEGDNAISYKLKNKIKVISNDQSQNLIELNFSSKKNNSIKERNIKNEITKYKLEITTTINYNFLNTDKKGSFIIKVQSDYAVAQKYSQTLKNQAEALETLTNKLSSEIRRKLSQKLNDF